MTSSICANVSKPSSRPSSHYPDPTCIYPLPRPDPDTPSTDPNMPHPFHRHQRASSTPPTPTCANPFTDSNPTTPNPTPTPTPTYGFPLTIISRFQFPFAMIQHSISLYKPLECHFQKINISPTRFGIGEDESGSCSVT